MWVRRQQQQTNKKQNKKTGTNAGNRHLTSVVHQTCKFHQNYGAVRMETINYEGLDGKT